MHEEKFVDAIYGLQIPGVHIGTIEHAETAFPSDQPLELAEFLVIYRSWEPQNIMSSYVGGGTTLGAFMKTLVFGHAKEDTPPHPSSTDNSSSHRPGTAPTSTSAGMRSSL
jgi:hypothetical protein